MKALIPRTLSLSAQMVVSFTALVLITAVATSLPALWLINNHLTQQAWEQIFQGTRTAQALYESQKVEILNLATLTAQRPTLQALSITGDYYELSDYLTELRAGAGFDFAAVCLEDLLVASTPQDLEGLEQLCSPSTVDGFFKSNLPAGPQVWLIGSHSIDTAETVQGKMKVVVGDVLDERFTRQMLAQTGLDHSIFISEIPLASSLSPELHALDGVNYLPVEQPGTEGSTNYRFEYESRPYYAARFQLSEEGVYSEVARSIVGIEAARRSALTVLIASILLVTVFASALGIFIAHRISQPLETLADSAALMSEGELNRSFLVPTNVREVQGVTQALEDARVGLVRTMGELRQELEWEDHLLDSIVEGILTLDQHRHITFFSSGAERITGWSRERVLNKDIDKVFILTDLADVFSNHMPPPGGENLLTVDIAGGRNATLAITGAKLIPSKAGAARVALVFRDVSEQEAIRRLLGQFMSNVAHEFRTPLSALAASIELLMEQIGELREDELHELINSIYLGTIGLETLVDNLLESASIEARRFQVSPRTCDLREIIADAVSTMEPLLKKYDQNLTIDIPLTLPEVNADARRTVQVLVNLLSNASKFGPAGAVITVSAHLLDGYVKVAVSDQGSGIPEEYRGDIFRRFVHPGVIGQEAKSGAGLGLSVVKAIIEAQGGQVGVADALGGGASFWFTLPTEGAA
jgi:PAS domain S-box-containing protein